MEETRVYVVTDGKRFLHKDFAKSTIYTRSVEKALVNADTNYLRSLIGELGLIYFKVAELI